jgi:hypothetical protein
MLRGAKPPSACIIVIDATDARVESSQKGFIY